MKSLKITLLSFVVAIFTLFSTPSKAQTFTGPGAVYSNQLMHDAAVAVGPNHVLAAVNYQWSVYNKTGTLLQNNLFTNWWGVAAGIPFGQRAYYDQSGHFVLIASSSGNGLGNMYVSVSQTDDPTGAWWNYVFDWSLDNGVPSGLYGDNPDLGFDDNSIFITANQFPLGGAPFFIYAKIRVLNKAQLFSGDPNPTWVDFTNLQNTDGSLASSVRPSRSVGPSASAYFINDKINGGNSVTLWRIDNSDTAPTLTRVGNVPVRAYIVPIGVAQAGGSAQVWVSDCRVQNVVHRNGVLYTAFTEGVAGSKKTSPTASVRYLQLSTAGVVSSDITVSGSTTKTGLYYPTVGVDTNGNVGLGYNRSSNTEYISFHYAKKPVGSSVFGSSLVIRNGTTYLPNPSWGRYNAVHNEGTNKLWFFGGVATVVPFTTVVSGVTLP